MHRNTSRYVCIALLAASACKPKPAPPAPDAGPAPVIAPGAHWSASGDALAFGARSRRATRVEVWLYAEARGAEARLHLPLAHEDGSDLWTARVAASDLRAAGLTGTVFYGLRAWGPNWPYDPAWAPGSSAGFQNEVDGLGNRFNPNKLLVDPYALELSHDPYQSDMADGSVYDATGPGRDKDSGPSAAKAIALQLGPLDTGAKPSRPLTDDVIYEVHLRGLTRGDASATCAGTFRAAADKAGYLRDLGVTAVEFLPVQETQNDDNPGDAPGNYWGYSTLGFLAPDRHYACDTSPGGPTRELAAMVKAFHDAGLKVFFDVVYNHTAETGSQATLSLRGLDNAAYYELSGDRQGYADNTGLGGNINAASPQVRDLVLASLHHFADDLGADGFRFDLAAVLGNRCVEGCFDFEPADPDGILQRAARELGGAALIAEPWGIGDGTYQLGKFPPGWAAWNDQYRDSLRRAQNKLGVEAVTPGKLADDLAGSPSVFGQAGAPSATVNHLVNHDGFTLADLYACNAKQNDQPWPYGPSGGGTDNNLSWDQGGDAAEQARAARTGLALLMLSAGVPMLAGGDEFGRSMRCNNNAYNLDSSANWLDWTQEAARADQVAWVKALLAFRAAHPALRPARYRASADQTWLTASGSVADSAYLADSSHRFLALRLAGAPSGDAAASLLIAYNEDTQPVEVTLPAAGAGRLWYRAGDTSGAASAFALPGAETTWPVATFTLGARAVSVFVER